MSNKEKDFIPYFKIKWARRSAWTIEQAAYLSAGKDPDGAQVKIGPNETNLVSKRFHWLESKVKRLSIPGREYDDGLVYYNTGSLFRPLRERFKLDKQMLISLDHMWQAPHGTDYGQIISKAVYRQAGRIVYKRFPDAKKMDVAEALVGLDKYYNGDEFGHIQSLQASTIVEFLRELGNPEPISGSRKPKLPPISLIEVIESM